MRGASDVAWSFNAIPDNPPTIVLANNAWEGSTANNVVAQYIIEKNLGNGKFLISEQNSANRKYVTEESLDLSGLATGASWLCYFRALQLGEASRVAPVDKLSVVIAIALAAIFLHEQLTWHHWVGGLLIFSGATVLAYA